MNLKNAYRNGTERLRASGVPEPELDAWYLLEYVTGIDRASYYADPDREMTESRKAEYDSLYICKYLCAGDAHRLKSRSTDIQCVL